jgi:ribonuclease PH
MGRLAEAGLLTTDPLRHQVAAVSVGIVGGTPRLDLDYLEDSAADTDMNCVGTDDGRYVELQGTAEREPFDQAQVDALLGLARHGLDELFAIQREAVERGRG